MLVNNKSDFGDKNKQLIKIHEDRNKMFAGQRMMFNNNAPRPPEFEGADWFVWAPPTEPSDAVWGGARVLSSIRPVAKMSPYSLNENSRQRAELYEQILLSSLMGASRTSKSKHIRQIVLNAILYDMVAVQYEFIPYSLNNLKNAGASEKMLKRAQKNSQFAFHARNSENVFPVHTEYGLTEVLHCQMLPTLEVLAKWGDRANKLESLAKDVAKGTPMQPWTLLADYWNEDQHILGAYPTADPNISWQEVSSGDKFEFLFEPGTDDALHGYDEIPWVVRGGGNTTESSSEYHHRPLNFSVWKSGQFDTYALVRSLMFSGPFAEFGQAMTVTETETGELPDEVRSGPGDPSGIWVVRQGDKVYRLPTVPFDTGLLQLAEQLRRNISESTLPRILLGEVASGIAFATLNLGQQSAIRSLIPFKELAEEVIAELLEKMCRIAVKAETDIEAWVSLKDVDKVLGNKPDERPFQKIPYKELIADRIMFEVELRPDLPVDNISKVNAAVMTLQLGNSRRDSLEMTGHDNAAKALADRQEEDLLAVEMANNAKTLSVDFEQQVEAQLRQKIAMEQQQQAAMQKAQVEQANAQRGGGQMMQGGGQGGMRGGAPTRTPRPNGEPGTKARRTPRNKVAKGRGVDTGRGGMPPAMQNPTATREGRTGTSRSGEGTA